MEKQSLTPHFPNYPQARAFLKVLEGIRLGLFRSMDTKLRQQMGSPQENVDWLDPEDWAPRRLEGEEQRLALRFWRESKGLVNPRHVHGSWYFCSHHGLIEADPQNILHITTAGQKFLAGDETLISGIDKIEGVLEILNILGRRSPARRADILQEYQEFCLEYTTARSTGVVKFTLYDRITNLIDRGLVERSAQAYTITASGLAYLQAHTKNQQEKASPIDSIRKLAAEQLQDARAKLKSYLAEMPPQKFEELIKVLLEEMDYTNVRVTPYSGDQGVDVVGEIEVGISAIREVVQVKRHNRTIQRNVLDQLRGSLHRIQAVRGTIITTSRFAKGCIEAANERGAAPITLIDGDKLVDLMIQHQIGIKKETVDIYNFDCEGLESLENEGEGVEE